VTAKNRPSKTAIKGCRGDRGEAEHGDVAQQWLLDGEHLERPFAYAFSGIVSFFCGAGAGHRSQSHASWWVALR
jgi:hypothetical protein